MSKSKFENFNEARDKSRAKLERDLRSGKQSFFDKSGEAEIKYEDNWINDVYGNEEYDPIKDSHR